MGKSSEKSGHRTPWERTSWAIREMGPQFKKAKFIFALAVLNERYGEYVMIENRVTRHMPCITFQALLNDYNLMETMKAPRYFNAQLGMWFCPPEILEEELKDYGFKWHWNHDHECEHCPSRGLCDIDKKWGM